MQNGRKMPNTTAFRAIVLCGFPSTPGHLEEHLVVIDAKDRAMFIGDPRKGEWQNFPHRIFLPVAEIELVGNTARCVADDAEQTAVDLHFNFNADVAVFIAAVESMYDDEHQKRIIMELQDMNPVPAGKGSGSKTLQKDLVTPRSTEQDSATPRSMPRDAARPLKVEAHLGYAQGLPSVEEKSTTSKQRARSTADLPEVERDTSQNPVLVALAKKFHEEPDQTQLAAYHLATTTIGQACKAIAKTLPIVDRRTPLNVVAAQFEEFDYLMYIDDFGREFIIGKSDFISRLLITSRSKETLDEWMHEALPDYNLDSFPLLPIMHHNKTLGHALTQLTDSGSRAICVKDNKHSIVGIISYEQIIEIAAQEFHTEITLKERKSAGAYTSKIPNRFAISFDPFAGWGALRTSAAMWVTSAVTETAIISLTFVDIGASVIDQFIFNPCVSCVDEYLEIKEYKGKAYDFKSQSDCLNALNLFDCDNAATLEHPMNAFTGAILMIFIVESITRVYAFRLSMFQSVLDALDFIIVYASAATFIWMVAAQGSKIVRKIVTVGRVMRFLRLIRMINKVRRALYADKMRFRKDGFNLDLNFITDNMIAMSVPSDGMEAKQYNDKEELSRYFRKYHLGDHGADFMIFSICGERRYHHNVFLNQVVEFPLENDDPPTLDYMCSFVEQVAEFLSASPTRVVAIHDLAGFARCGVFVACWLVYSGFSQSTPQIGAVEDAKQWFCLKRKGRVSDESVEYAPGQLRYMEYFKRVVDDGGFKLPAVILDQVVMWTVPNMRKQGGSCPWFVINQGQKEIFDYSKHNKIEQGLLKSKEKSIFECGGLQMRGDIKITFFDHNEEESTDEEMFSIFFHTGFVDKGSLRLPLKEIDSACRDEKHSVYSKDFLIELVFSTEDDNRTDSKKRTVKPVWKELKPASEKVKDEALAASALLRSQIDLKKKTSVVSTTMRSMVSQDRRRFQEDGFDLDLTYITKQIIAMGAPASGAEVIYRNDAEEQKRFFNVRHPNNYMIYKLAAEFDVDSDIFDDACLNCSFGFLDHQAPTLPMIKAFCTHVHEFISQSPKRVVGVFCLAGKGRTGCMISCYLLFSRVFKDSLQAMDFFATQRTRDGQGVTVPSQRKYVQYFDLYLRYKEIGLPPPIGDDSVQVKLEKLIVHGLAKAIKVHMPVLIIRCATVESKNMEKKKEFKIETCQRALGSEPEEEEITFVIQDDQQRSIFTKGDIKFFIMSKALSGKQDEIFSFQVHSTFMGSDWNKEGDLLHVGGSELDPSRKGTLMKNKSLNDTSVDLSFFRLARHPLYGLPRQDAHLSGQTHAINIGSNVLIEYE